MLTLPYSDKSKLRLVKYLPQHTEGKYATDTKFSPRSDSKLTDTVPPKRHFVVKVFEIHFLLQLVYWFMLGNLSLCRKTLKWPVTFLTCHSEFTKKWTNKTKRASVKHITHNQLPLRTRNRMEKNNLPVEECSSLGCMPEARINFTVICDPNKILSFSLHCTKYSVNSPLKVLPAGRYFRRRDNAGQRSESRSRIPVIWAQSLYSSSDLVKVILFFSTSVQSTSPKELTITS